MRRHEACTRFNEARRATRATQATAGAPLPHDALRLAMLVAVLTANFAVAVHAGEADSSFLADAG